MGKSKTQFVCKNCGHNNPKWLGRCPSCDGWNTFVEEKTSPLSEGGDGSLAALREEFKRDLSPGASSPSRVVQLSDSDDEPQSTSQPHPRYSTGLTEMDRVLGGGLVRDSFTLLGGDPGIGKSTLLLQTAHGLIQRSIKENKPLKILYVSGEESTDQIRSRAHRLGVRGSDRLFLAAETQLERAFDSVKQIKPDVLIMDSLQTFSSGVQEGAPGSVGQVREVAARLMTLAKTSGIAVLLVGHVTKEGNIAGPKVVEHIVDTVLYFEGDGAQNYRLLRTVKNRFGSSRELGVFEMEGEGLREVTNPSALFLEERREAVAGTAVAASIEGSRPILVELQALVSHSPLALPRRTAVGMDSARIALIAAILERHVKVSLAQKDLFFNVSGGLRLSEPACDLAAAAAIWSSFSSIAIPQDWVFVGELGLTGEVRRVPLPEARLEEAKKLGFKTAIIPRGSAERVSKISGIKIHAIGQASELTRLLS